ncbi:RTA1 like protein-domain-containing protein [Rhexocercosporidium sp. MPI-PUGE-AT-0058]|nr:RTA1 like protein-domain-containing protein [Rhexocercosporidium sp. MPI-PUGE-AT-0058]
MSSSTGEVDFMDCTRDTCTVEQSVYGYYPSAAASYIFIAIFGLSAIAHLVQGIMTKSWSFLTVLTIGTVMEAIGYVGRVLLRNDPFSGAFVAIQLICITVAPAFIAAGIYLTLKHLIIVHGSQFSRLAPKWYTWIFIASDITSIIIQSIGAAIAANGSSTTTGNNIIMAGLASQVFTLLIFGLMAFDVWARIRKHTGEFNESASAMRESRRFKILIGAIVVAYAAVLIRFVYRIAEMAGGWSNAIMQDQPSFIVLESVMMGIVVVALNVGHPGSMFVQARKVVGKSATEGSEMQVA